MPNDTQPVNEPEPMIPYHRARSWWSNPVFPVFVGLVWAFCFSNLLLGAGFFETDIPFDYFDIALLPMGMAMGMLGAQAALHAIWTVFGTWAWRPRFLVSIFTALLLFFATWIPSLIDEPESDIVVDMVNGLLCMPLLLFAIQAPLWVIKASWRFGIVPAHVLSSSVQTRALSIRDLLVATATIAVATAAPRFTALPSDLSGNSQFPVEIGLAAGAASVISLLVVVSALLITLCIPHAVISMLLASLVQVVVCVGSFVVMCVMSNEPPDGDDIVIVAGILIGFTTSLNVPLVYLRRQGYRLQRAGRSQRQD